MRAPDSVDDTDDVPDRDAALDPVVRNEPARAAEEPDDAPTVVARIDAAPNASV